MSSRETMLNVANAQERCLDVMRACSTPAEIRSGFARVAEIMGPIPGQTALVESMRAAAEETALDDRELFELRDLMITQFTKQSAFLRRSGLDLPRH